MAAAEAVRLTEAWMRTIQRAAYLASASLAAEKGAFPLFDRDRTWPARRSRARRRCARGDRPARHPQRAAHLGRADRHHLAVRRQRLSGLEPVFSFRYVRHVLMPDGSRREEEVSDHAYRLFRRLKGEARRCRSTSSTRRRCRPTTTW